MHRDAPPSQRPSSLPSGQEWRQRARRVAGRIENAGRGRREPLDRPVASDWWFTALVSAIPVTGYLIGPQTMGDQWQLPWSAPVWVGALLLIPQLLPLAWRRVRPHEVMAIVGWSTGLYFALGFAYVSNIIGVIVALYAEAAYGRRRISGIASLLISFGFIGGFALLSLGELDRHDLPIYAFNLFGFTTAWAAGDAVRSRRLHLDELHARATEAERHRVLEAERAVLDERTRIARELHDLVAHTVSVMVVQAGAGRRVASVAPDRATEAFATIEDTGRTALSELRRLVGVLRDGDAAADLAPQPSLEALPELVATLVGAGVPVTLEVEGAARQVPAGVEVTVFRLVQEALTNVLKHAGAVRDVRVRLHYEDAWLEVLVVDDGRGTAAPVSSDGAGHIGMRERAALFGGTVDAGPRSDGGYRVRARLPLDSTGTSSVASLPASGGRR